MPCGLRVECATQLDHEPYASLSPAPPLGSFPLSLAAVASQLRVPVHYPFAGRSVVAPRSVPCQPLPAAAPPQTPPVLVGPFALPAAVDLDATLATEYRTAGGEAYARFAPVFEKLGLRSSLRGDTNVCPRMG